MSIKKVKSMVDKLSQYVDQLNDEKLKKAITEDVADTQQVATQTDAQIVLEVGHGPHPDGFEPGAVDPKTGIQEWNLNAVLADACAHKLQNMGYTNVTITDENDYLFSIGVKYASADVFVSCHHNAFHDSAAQGTEVLVHPEARESDRELAQDLVNAMSEALGLANRGIKEMKLGVLSGSTLERHEKNHGCVLVEPYFITGTGIDHYAMSERAGHAMAHAIHEFLEAGK